MREMLPILLVVLLFVPACGGIAPSPQAAHSLSKSYFKSYGKKYKGSLFGQSSINKVEIHRIQGLSRHKAELESILYFENGTAAHVLVTARKHPLFGWRVSSWETMGVSSQ